MLLQSSRPVALRRYRLGAAFSLVLSLPLISLSFRTLFYSFLYSIRFRRCRRLRHGRLCPRSLSRSVSSQWLTMRRWGLHGFMLGVPLRTTRCREGSIGLSVINEAASGPQPQANSAFIAYGLSKFVPGRCSVAIRFSHRRSSSRRSGSSFWT